MVLGDAAESKSPRVRLLTPWGLASWDDEVVDGILGGVCRPGVRQTARIVSNAAERMLERDCFCVCCLLFVSVVRHRAMWLRVHEEEGKSYRGLARILSRFVERQRCLKGEPWFEQDVIGCLLACLGPNGVL
jgi:hypothetical protein